MRVYLALTALLFSFSCITQERDTGHKITMNAGAFQTQLTTSSGKEISIHASHPKGMSLSDIVISTMGFDNNLQDTIFDSDPVMHIFVDDLDQNGYDELYIVTVSAGSGSYANVIGYASNRDKSMSMIHLSDFERNSELFSEYRGHDQFSIEQDKLIRVFPIYKSVDPNNAPSGGKRKLTYGLTPGEAMWQLTILKSEHISQ